MGPNSILLADLLSENKQLERKRKIKTNLFEQIIELLVAELELLSSLVLLRVFRHFGWVVVAVVRVNWLPSGESRLFVVAAVDRRSH